MAHQNLRSHFKLRKLAKLLNVPLPHACGLLEFIWQDAYSDRQVGPDGKLHRKETSLADVAEWDGDPSQFAQALVDSGFIDRQDGEICIHDYRDWVPEFVRDRWRKRLDVPGVSGEFRGIPGNYPTGTGRDGTGRTGKGQVKEDSSDAKASSESASPPSADLQRKPRTRKPDPVWDAVAAEFFPSGVAPGDRTRCGKAVRDLKAKGVGTTVDVSEIKTRKDRWDSVFSKGKPTLFAVLNHWDDLVPPESEFEATVRRLNAEQAEKKLHPERFDAQGQRLEAG